ncbi:MAG: LysR family transcriptional regulator, partial [Bacteroidales bacterium]
SPSFCFCAAKVDLWAKAHTFVKRKKSIISIDKTDRSNMELRQLKYFSEAAACLNFTEAARRLFITQSTLSQQVKQLEEELGIPLFDRIGKHVRLTEAGESFLPYARQTLQSTEYGKQKIRDLQQIHCGTLRIGVTYSLSPLLTNAIVAFNRKYPDIRLDIQYFSSAYLLNRLREHHFDFILSFLPNKKDDIYESLALFDSSLVLVAHRSHSLAPLNKIDWMRLQKEPLILPSVGLSARSVLDSLLTKRNIRLTPQIETNDVGAILQLVKTGRWVSLLSKATVLENPELKAIPLQDKGAEMQASLIWLRDAYQQNSARAFRSIMEESARNYNAHLGTLL